MDKKRASIIQILILIISILAFSYSIGSEIKFVEAAFPLFGDYSKGDVKIPNDIAIPNPARANINPADIETAEKGLEKGIIGDIGNIGKGGGGKDKFILAKMEFWKGLGKAAWWGAVAYGATKMLGEAFGLEEGAVNAASTAAGFGAFAGKGASLIWKEGFWKMSQFKASLGVGIVVGAVVFLALYKDESTQVITLTCEPWQAPAGGNDCEKCNNGVFPCSEYQCKSLGQACELLNAGTENEKCVWVNRNDVEFPIIEPWDDALLIDYEYRPDNAISPPDRGVKIINTQSQDGCAEAFTPLKFGITLDEPGQCKLDYQRKDSFDDMENYFGGSSLFKYNHSQTMGLPGADAVGEANLTLYNDGNYGIYVRCQDANGNKNIANFVFKFCVEKGPDTTPPLIVTTNILDGTPIAYNQTEVEDFILYTNEPADCKWSRTDQDYESMENEMACPSSITEMNAQMVYECGTTLTGLKNKQDNEFYFRCKDQPTKTEDRNTNQESYSLTLIGTRPLYINSIKPNGTIKDSTDPIKVTLEVKTSAGYNEGEATCSYSESCYKEDGDNEDYTSFYYGEGSMSYAHKQELWVNPGSYECSIRCIDLGGNSDTVETEYTVETDTEAPVVVRVYYEENYLKLITDEEAECVYDTTNCEYLFEDGTPMSKIDKTKHFTDWNTEIDYYIKCRDNYGKEPLPNECSIIARPFEIEF